MAIPSSGPLAMTAIQTEFGGSNPISLSEYYAGGSYVGSGTSGTYGAVPSSGTISIQNFYGTSAGPVPSQQAFTTAGTYTWVAPTAVTTISVVCVGGGGAGGGGSTSPSGGAGGGGGGGALGWQNNITVVPGNGYTVVVGDGAITPSSGAGAAPNGGQSSITVSGTTYYANGGVGGAPASGGTGGGTNMAGGGSGGRGYNANQPSASYFPCCNAYGGNATSGGGAGGYSGNGGNGGSANGGDQSGVAGSGGAGSGGGQPYGTAPGAGGGGVGILGQGTSGATASAGGNGGSGGSNGTYYYDYPNPSVNGLSNGGVYGGGGGGWSYVYVSSFNRFGGQNGANGGVGAVRIIWPGNTRSFPSTNTGNL